jgi:hypothetical protein
MAGSRHDAAVAAVSPVPSPCPSKVPRMLSHQPCRVRWGQRLTLRPPPTRLSVHWALSPPNQVIGDDSRFWRVEATHRSPLQGFSVIH